ncbi:unnamed protein product [Medioppia subpectinata]|uniref:Uncharacterized protein n=1 Tax=Medioppia subpectinata TaxID=1979941 RepID=A0A7R9KM63_9ACAR|nr:unnamed protein product [Medioppia subpectinata]CAG2105815.1 unnamed protein product [Medioppia subpectinata]
MRNGTTILEKKLESRHTMVSAKECIPQLIKGETIRLEGYLFKRTSNTFKTWNRRWFIIQDHQLVYQKRSHERELTIMEEDLRLCTAKPVQFMERRFCFEVLSPSKSHILQADSEETCQQWISAMQAGIDAAYNHNDAAVDIQSVHSQDSWGTASSNSSANKSSSFNNLLSATDGSCGGGPPPAKPPRVTYTQILAIPGNEFCCDCGAADPKWASINIGSTLCIECSGIHRSLGVHLSKVRSLNLDAWDLELIKVMSSLGNTIINTIYEAKVDESVAQRAKSDSDRTQRELWIKAKYVKRAFVDKLEVDLLATNEQQLPLSSTDSTIICDHNKSGEQIEPNVDNESHNTFNSTLSCVQMSDTTVNKCDNISQMSDKRNEELVESDSEESDSEESTKLILSDNTLKNVTQNCDNNCHTVSDDKQVVTLGRDYDKSVVENNSSIKPMPSGDNNEVYNLMLYNAAIDCDVKVMCEALAKGAIINWHNADDENRTALHQAISSDRVTPCEYLLLNGAKSNVADHKGTTPLHLATQRGNTGQVCLLLKRGADQKCTDSDGHNALSIAVNNANADIVTLLRLAKLNDEMKNDDEFGNISDETFNEVVRDFTQLAAQSPEKLRRNTIQPEPNS